MGTHIQQNQVVSTAQNNRSFTGNMTLTPSPSFTPSNSPITNQIVTNFNNMLIGCDVPVTGRRKIYDSYMSSSNALWNVNFEADHEVQFGNTGLTWTTLPSGAVGYQNNSGVDRLIFVTYTIFTSNQGEVGPDNYNYTTYILREYQTTPSLFGGAIVGKARNFGNNGQFTNAGSHWAAFTGHAFMILPNTWGISVRMDTTKPSSIKVVGSSPSGTTLPVPGPTQIQVADFTDLLNNTMVDSGGIKRLPGLDNDLTPGLVTAGNWSPL